MANSAKDNNIINPFIPSLHHLVSVNIAKSMLSVFEIETLKKVYTEIQCKNREEMLKAIGNESLNDIFAQMEVENREENYVIYKKAKMMFLDVPAHLRRRVFEALIGISNSLRSWRIYHLFIPTNGCPVSLRPDGSVDKFKSSQQLVLHKEANIQTRFEIACHYCLEKDVYTLWSEMEASGETENFETGYVCMARFWIDRMRNGSKVPWPQAVLEFIELYRPVFPSPRYSSFFHLLNPRNRQKCLMLLQKATNVEDLILCLYSMTKAEQEQILKLKAYEVLLHYLEWPLQSLFTEISEKMWPYLDVESVLEISVRFILCMFDNSGHNHLELFESHA